ncbi:LysR family transcriptional regulator [Vibrio superstes NBRC 103154]|uniref:LysR family transcriptional regulator n=2 Tax=Vibrio superstes TaxID=198815 RepID=A0A511QNX7_9VIBR|nr:LysR family transcriptional regulator [Vibrio superstes NBRC 103154]
MLGISQSAISQTLSKLREYTQDKLFYVVGTELQTTPRADIIGQGLNNQIQQLDAKFTQHLFDSPETFNGELTIAVSSIFLEAIASELTHLASEEAFPNAKINIVNWDDETGSSMVNGTVHMGLNFFPIEHPKTIRAVRLTSTTPVVIAQKNHPWLQTDLSANEFIQYPTGGILMPGLSDFNAVLERNNLEWFKFKYRSASMSVLASLTKSSPLLTVTEGLSASMCNDGFSCVQPKWLEDLTKESFNHAIYYLDKNHSNPLYKYATDIIHELLINRMNDLKSRMITTPIL